MAEPTSGIAPIVSKPHPEPWAAPGVSVQKRVELLDREHNLQGVQGFATGFVAAALRATLEDAARVAEDMGFYAIAARIRALKGNDR